MGAGAAQAGGHHHPKSTHRLAELDLFLGVGCGLLGQGRRPLLVVDVLGVGLVGRSERVGRVVRRRRRDRLLHRHVDNLGRAEGVRRLLRRGHRRRCRLDGVHPALAACRDCQPLVDLLRHPGVHAHHPHQLPLARMEVVAFGGDDRNEPVAV